MLYCLCLQSKTSSTKPMIQILLTKVVFYLMLHVLRNTHMVTTQTFNINSYLGSDKAEDEAISD